MYAPGAMGGMNTDGREDYDNVEVQQMREKLGAFKYDDAQFEMSLG